jgi:uncharacterized protein (TIGR04222 family)
VARVGALAVQVIGILAGLVVVVESPIAGAVLFLVALALLLVVPELTEHGHARGPGPPEQVAREWLAGPPDPLALALVAGGPGRVADVVLAELLASGRLSVAVDTVGLAGSDPPGETRGAARHDVVRRRLADGGATVRDVRRAVAESGETPARWDDAARAGVLRARGRRLPAGELNEQSSILCSLGACVAGLVAALRADAMPVWLAVVLFVVAGPLFVCLPVVAHVAAREARFVRARVDPRTAAGRRALDLAEAEPWASDRPYRVALHGLSALPAGEARERLCRQAPPSRWPDPAAWRDRLSRDRDEDPSGDDGSGWSGDEVLDVAGGEGWDADAGSGAL